MSAQPRRLGLWIPWALFVAAALGWFAYWSVLKTRAIAQLDGWAAAHRAAGGDARWRSVRADGFPMRLSLRLDGVSIAARDRAWAVATERASIHINPTNVFHILGEADAPLRLTLDGRPLAVRARHLGFSVRLKDSALARASLLANDLTWRAADDAAAPIASAARGLLHVRPDPRTPGAFQVALEIDQWRPRAIAAALRPLGPTIEQVRAAIVIEDGATLADAGALRWSQAGHGARLEAGALRWGPAQASATGRLSIDAQRRPNGEIVLRLSEPRAALAPLAANPTLAPAAAAALARASAAPAPLDLALSASRGQLTYAGIVPLTGLDPLPGTQP